MACPKLEIKHKNEKKFKKLNFQFFSPKSPLFDLIGHEDKVHDCDWSNSRYMVSGGADNTVRIFKSKKDKGISS